MQVSSGEERQAGEGDGRAWLDLHKKQSLDQTGAGACHAGEQWGR